MTAQPPIACSLSATDLRARLVAMADLGRAALLDARIDAARADLRFTAGAGVRRRLEAIVAAEAECCGFLTMQVTDEDDAIALAIQAPEGAGVVLAGIVEAFSATASASGARRRR